MTSLAFTVHDSPVTQGSVRAYVKGGRAQIVSTTAPLTAWRESVRLAAVTAAGPRWVTQDEAVMASLSFYLPRPATAPKTRDTLPSHGKTDLDKYIRAVFDAITNAGIWTDDSRVVGVAAFKFYAVGPHLHRIFDPNIHRTTPRLEASLTWLNDSTTGSSGPSSSTTLKTPEPASLSPTTVIPPSGFVVTASG